MLKRAIKTAWLILDELEMQWVPITNSWRLNERNYGALQGRRKQECRDEFGLTQVGAPPLSTAIGGLLSYWCRFGGSIEVGTNVAEVINVLISVAYELDSSAGPEVAARSPSPAARVV